MRNCNFAALALASLPALCAVQASAGEERHWTIEDIVTVPEVSSIALSDDRDFAIYSVRAADIPADRIRSTLRLIDARTGIQRDLLTADEAEQLKPIPKSDDWSALLDIGEGMQLYRINRAGKVTPLLVNSATMLTGSADMALPGGAAGGPRQIGILAHDWSPDGRWLWYSVLKPIAGRDGPRFDASVTGDRDRGRSRIDASIEIRIRGPDGGDTIVATRPSRDRVARYFGGELVWQGGDVLFRAEEDDGSEDGRFETYAWDLSERRLRRLESERNGQNFWVMKGPRGGQLTSRGVGDRLELAESFTDGSTHSYGHFPFTVGDPRSAGVHIAVDGKSAILGTRTVGNPRYGLAFVSRTGVREIGSGSFTRCDFSTDLEVGVCVREGISSAPELVRVEARRGRVTRLATVSARHAAITPLTVRPRVWTNRLGYKANGYVVLPRGYRDGHRYPAIVVTHGSDADERFANVGLQWEYPVQVWAERGYIVVLINDPRSRQSEDLTAAYAAWSRGGGPPGPEEVQRLIWLNGVYSFEDAVSELVAKNIVDPARVGIAGFSRGSQMVNVTITQSHMFRAASGGDGSLLEPYSYPAIPQSYNAIFGGSPFSEHIDRYRRFSPSLNAHKACAALLQQVVKPRSGAIDLYQALRVHNVPSQLTLYPGESAASDETHVFHIPSNRLTAQRENIAWFDYWLLDRFDPTMPFSERLPIWDAMAKDMNRPRCQLPNNPDR